MVSLNETIDDIKAAVESADPALGREELIALGVSEKAGANRKTLLKYLREAAKALPVGVEDPVDAPGEPPPGYVSTPEVEMKEAPVEPLTAYEPGIPPQGKPLMQQVDPRKCNFPFSALDVNRYPVCVVHNSGLCLPCSHEPDNEKSGAMRCRVVCFAESDKHHNVKQPTVVTKERVIGNPATVEMVDLSEFDE